MLNENCFTYLIEKDGKTYFHGTDSGEILESTFEYLEKNKIHIDVYAIDCTYTFLTTNYGGHMNLLQNAKMKDRLEKIGAFDKNSRMIATHIAMAGQATHKELVKKAVAKYGDKIAVGVDIRDGFVAIKGWTQRSDTPAFDFCRELEALGVKTIICTDISKDGAMMGANHDLYKKLSEEIGINIIASGGVSCIDDVKRLREMNLYGAIIGKAYYTNAISLPEAIEVAK
jgi:uncharacterized protein related to proFAR isomerase